MNRILSLLLIALLIASIGCKKDDGNPSSFTQKAPSLPILSFKEPNTTSDSAKAILTKSFVTTMNALITAGTIFSGISSKNSGNTYTWTVTSQGEIYTLTADIQSNGNYSWTLVYSGIASGIPLVDFTLWQGTTSADGKKGNWAFYETGQTGVVDSLIYSTNTSNVLTGTWIVYNAYQTVSSKLVIINHQDGAGELNLFNNGTILTYKAVWIANGSGTWYTYNSSGVITGTGTWI